MPLEICIETLYSAIAAKAGGADRIEVCGALSIGGITPSFGLVEQCITVSGIGVMMMIRPHAGIFCYTADELAIMRRDIRVAKELGAQGVVFGALTCDARVDRAACAQLIDEARPLETTFHRAYDLTNDPLAALEDVIELGFDRLLTSGQAKTALQGSELIRQLVHRSGDRLAVMPGGGIRPDTIAELMRATDAKEYHCSASRTSADTEHDYLDLVHQVFEAEAATVAMIAQTIMGIDLDGRA